VCRGIWWSSYRKYRRNTDQSCPINSLHCLESTLGYWKWSDWNFWAFNYLIVHGHYHSWIRFNGTSQTCNSVWVWSRTNSRNDSTLHSPS
jgi:hypothetical protein